MLGPEKAGRSGARQGWLKDTDGLWPREGTVRLRAVLGDQTDLVSKSVSHFQPVICLKSQLLQL